MVNNPYNIYSFPPLLKDKIHFKEWKNVKLVQTHSHSFLEFSYITRGPVEHNLNGTVTTLNNGDFMIVDYGSTHSYHAQTKSGYDNINFLFLPEFIDPILKGIKSIHSLFNHYLLHYNLNMLKVNPAQMIFHDNDGKIFSLLNQIKEEYENKSAGYIEMIRCHLISLLLFIMRKLDDATLANKGNNITSFLTTYVSEHYMKPITLSNLAAKTNYSLSYLSQRFKDDMGVSFISYLQDYRITQACRLLITTNKTISEIAEIVGYYDVKFFSLLIKRKTGLAPSLFRKKNRA